MPFCCAVMQVSAVLRFDNHVSQHAVRALFSVHSAVFSMLWEAHSFEVMFAPCRSNPTMASILSLLLDMKTVICDTEVSWPTLLLQSIEKLTVGAEAADLVSALCHCAACLCWNYASKGRDR